MIDEADNLNSTSNNLNGLEEVISNILEDALNQFNRKPDPNSLNRYLLIELDLNLTNIDSTLSDYLLSTIRNSLTEVKLFTPSQFIIFTIIYFIIIIVGFISNFLLIYAFYMAKKLRTSRNIFIINLAIR